MILNVWIDKDEESGSYTASVPELRGVHTQGDTLEEVEANVRDAIDTWLEYATVEELGPVLSRRHWTLEVDAPATLCASEAVPAAISNA